MVFRFGTFEFDDQSAELRKNGRAVALEPQPAKALARLLVNPGDVVSREALRDAVWGAETHVDFDRGLAYCLSQIRAALGDSGENPRFVQTIPKRGYKFIAPVSGSAGSASILPNAIKPPQPPPWMLSPSGALFVLLLLGGWYLERENDRRSTPRPALPVIIGVSIFDNETGLAEHDRIVAGLSDLVVARLTAIDSERLAVVGNATILRQPRNIRNLRAVQQSLQADYVLLGQLQTGETGLRFITHFIRLKDEAHLRANRLPIADPNLAGLETAVVEEFERAVREHVLNRPSN